MKMRNKTKPTFILLLCLVINNHNLSSLQANTISENQTLYGYSTIVSANGVFQLGFFKPGKPDKYYVGIWYQKDPQRNVVWVANRDNPVSYYAELRISRGNLVLFNEFKSPVWSTNITSGASVQAVLLDTGNLIMTDNGRRHLWESFDHPAHTWLPGSKLVYDKIAKTSRPITSWKNSEDPSPGIFTLELGPDSSFSVIWNRSVKYWTSGAWNGAIFSLIPEMRGGFLNYQYVSTETEDYLVHSHSANFTSRYMLDVSGQIKLVVWHSNRNWNLIWSQPRQQCDVYGFCGEFGTCSMVSLHFCSCLTGFEPKSQSDWDLQVYSGGCVRKSELECGSTGFEEMRNVSLPNDQMVFEAESVKECESKCLNNCSCIAYAYKSDTRCLIWSESLFNLRQYVAENIDGNTLFIRLAASEFDSSKNESGKRRLYIIVFGTISAALLIMFASYCTHHRKGRKVVKNQDHRVGLYDTEKQILNFLKSGQFRDDEKRGIEVPFVALESILAATDNFSEENKLGQGGFGPVYKGKFPGGQEIAIKRLSSGSGQGLEEFKNEVLLIAKLQHRNLVRLLGYCVEGDEKMLLYEYMPNKSLDSFVFDGTLRVLLNWEIRFDIIMGIARGLVYLHHDSRLRIIHRDLKTSNVLLDEEMNPKISDFGLARIFGSKQTEANTNRVVGTYGYMSPEYALEGFFSIKSDVFSFGVMVLEIITGKRNTGFYNSEQAMSLLGYAWKLWREDKALDIMDVTLSESCATSELLRCVNVGLLCVQEDPSDRPTMPNVVFMLGNETACLPSPKQPAFVPRISTIFGSSSTPSSENELTATTLQGR